MKIVDTDNFGGDYLDEATIAEGITNEEFARIMCDALNNRFADSRFYYKVVPDDYKLKRKE